MLLADQWKEYQLLECGSGMKKERWGDVVTVRPDPQVIWPKSGSSKWSDFDAFYFRSKSGGGKWDYRNKLPQSWTINYKHLKFKISPTSFKHTGLFPEQAVNWEWSMNKIREAKRPIKVLNLFGYTGAASCAALSAGAEVTHVDASKGMVNWCRENVKLSGLQDKVCRFIVDDCLKYVQRDGRRGKTYDAIIMDPPSYGRGKNGETWKIDDNLWELLADCQRILTDQPLFFLINSYTTWLSPTVLTNMLRDICPSNGAYSCGEIGIPIKGDQKVLPGGIYARWESN